MANKTSIEWTDFNWNFFRGCSRVSEGCRNCYAENVAARFSGEGQPYEGLAKFVDHKPRWTGEIGYFEDVLLQPLRWTKPRKVFVNSMSDLFHEKVQDEWLDKAFAVMALTPQHTYQILTKRPERMRKWFKNRGTWPIITMLESLKDAYPAAWNEEVPHLREIEWPRKNVWLGVSVEDQKTADERIPLLLQTPAAIRWLSIEPLLGPVDLGMYLSRNGLFRQIDPNFVDPISGADWVVVGGESGPNARPMHPEWARWIRDKCHAAVVPFFFKQWGEWFPLEMPNAPAISAHCDHEIVWPDGTTGTGSMYENGGLGMSMFKVGKKKAGRILDGRTWDEMPEVAR